jgi:hypothetical protein
VIGRQREALYCTGGAVVERRSLVRGELNTLDFAAAYDRMKAAHEDLIAANDLLITSLVMQHACAGDLTQLASFIARNTTITSLDLSGTFMTDVEVPFLVTMLNNNTTLKTLRVHDSSIGHGAAKLADALAVNQTLTMLDLRRNKVNAD